MKNVKVIGIPQFRGGDVPVCLLDLLGSLWSAHARVKKNNAMCS